LGFIIYHNNLLS